MAQATAGDTVRIHYTGRLADGSIFDSSTGNEPLSFTLGEGEVIPGFERAVMGMEPGQQQTVTIPSDEAYGSLREDLILDVPRTQFPPDLKPEVGQQLQMQQDGQAFVVTVHAVSDEAVTLNANHPLAGEDLTFELTLVEIA